MQKSPSNIGLLIALLVLGCWTTSIILLMQWRFSFANPLLYLLILVQMHLYTGLFITAHDAMHGTVSSNRTVNNLIGYVCTFLYASFWYPKLYTKHHQHHDHVHTANDPDYHEGGFWSWYDNKNPTTSSPLLTKLYKKKRKVKDLTLFNSKGLLIKK